MRDEAEWAWLREHFERCWPWLAAALDRQPYKTHEKHHIWEAIATGAVQFWPTANAAVITEIREFPTGLKVISAWLAGGDLDEIRNHTQPAIEAYGRGAGCHVLSMTGRRGWLRALPHFEEAGTTAVKDLTNGLSDAA